MAVQPKLGLYFEECKGHLELSKRCTTLSWGTGHSLHFSGPLWGVVVKTSFDTIWRSSEGTSSLSDTLRCSANHCLPLNWQNGLQLFCKTGLQSVIYSHFAILHCRTSGNYWLSGLVVMANFGLSKPRNTWIVCSLQVEVGKNWWNPDQCSFWVFSPWLAWAQRTSSIQVI